MSLKENSGAKLWQQAKKIIPGGNQLLSKRAEMFLPEAWPAYYKKSKGCEVWDLDNNHYYDFSIMGIGTSSLGYSHAEVNEAVITAIQDGTMSSLNCPEEVELAEKLIALHPWAGAARFTRTGGESCALAIRIARAYAKKDMVAFCGYHGWHDWYLATNINDKGNLDEQLLPGLKPAGVPQQLGGSVLPFKEGDIEGFKEILAKHSDKLGVVMMEVFRHGAPNLTFIREIRALCDQHNIVLIFDEISSGFRLNTGASHLLWDIEPDICVLGKALGNGHPIGAVIGKHVVMDAAQQSFISSSYWTERVGFVAALKTLEIFESQNVPERLMSIGQYLKLGLSQVAEETGFDLKIIGIDSVPIFIFPGDNPLATKTLFTQEMLKRGYLASNVIYLSIAHTTELIDKYLDTVKEVFTMIKNAMEQGIDLKTLIENEVCHSGFQRLN
ncbi:aminotransferase class III-fold pyridoxal phosphate-dependent enzyme [Pseudoalteromonas sp. SSM20]|uniref:aminotransferase class III-fold pyridoxal phosphate-dependent enzyme n=1 Tax=Pseudoalteromonas sp. SSM20 TaxID=3139394 RepID=UPI003BAA31E7